MKFKKFASAALAGAMALSMTATAFASSITDLSEGAELEVSGSTQGATISLTVPSSANVVLNPYKMDVKLTDESTVVKDQVVSAVYFIENNSSLAIKVDISATGMTEGEAKLVATAGEVTGNDKVANVYLAHETVVAADAATVTTVADTNSIVLASGTAATGSAVLAATDGDEGKVKDVLAFMFKGTANDKAATPWTEEDTVSATVVFSFSVDNT